MKLTATVCGKKNCKYCDNRKEVLKKFPAIFKKKTGGDMDIDIVYYDIKTVDGLVALCREDRTNGDIPIVILENGSETLGVWAGAKQTLSSKDLLELFA